MVPSRRFTSIITASILWVSLLAHAAAETPEEPYSYPVYSDEVYDAVIQFYGYDRSIPLDARTLEQRDFPDHVREKVVFTGVRDSRVPGYLGLPKTNTGPRPCVLLVNGITGTKERWWEDDSWPHGGKATKQLFAAGFAVLALDAKYHGERIAENDYESPARMAFRHKWYHRTREMLVQTTVEYRRAIDYLATRSEIDIERIGVLGHSMGGLIIFALNACEPRIKSSVACVTPLQFMKPAELSLISPHNFARGIGARPFLMMMGTSDPYYTPHETEQLFETIEGNPKRLSFYESGHRLPEAYIAESVEWFEANLK